MSGEEAGQATGCEAWPGANPACLSVYSSRVADIAVPKVGLEPTRGFPHRILSPARLPIPPLRRGHLVALKPTSLRSAHESRNPDRGRRLPRAECSHTRGRTERDDA